MNFPFKTPFALKLALIFLLAVSFNATQAQNVLKKMEFTRATDDCAGKKFALVNLGPKGFILVQRGFGFQYGPFMVRFYNNDFENTWTKTFKQDFEVVCSEKYIYLVGFVPKLTLKPLLHITQLDYSGNIVKENDVKCTEYMTKEIASFASNLGCHFITSNYRDIKNIKDKQEYLYTISESDLSLSSKEISLPTLPDVPADGKLAKDNIYSRSYFHNVEPYHAYYSDSTPCQLIMTETTVVKNRGREDNNISLVVTCKIDKNGNVSKPVTDQIATDCTGGKEKQYVTTFYDHQAKLSYICYVAKKSCKQETPLEFALVVKDVAGNDVVRKAYTLSEILGKVLKSRGSEKIKIGNSVTVYENATELHHDNLNNLTLLSIMVDNYRFLLYLDESLSIVGTQYFDLGTKGTADGTPTRFDLYNFNNLSRIKGGTVLGSGDLQVKNAWNYIINEVNSGAKDVEKNYYLVYYKDNYQVVITTHYEANKTEIAIIGK